MAPRWGVATACGLCAALSTTVPAAHAVPTAEQRLMISASHTLPLVLVSPEATWTSMQYWKIRPSRLLLSRQQLIKNLRWTRWGAQRATGKGTYWVATCDPTCAEGVFYKEGSVKLVLSQPKEGRFRKLVIQRGYSGDGDLSLHLRHASYWNWA